MLREVAVLQYFEKVGLLRRIDSRVERDVDPPDPPAPRQFQREVAPRLQKLPAADRTALTELTYKARQPVVPVVVAWNRCEIPFTNCLLYTSDAADERSSVDLGGRRIIKK